MFAAKLRSAFDHPDHFGNANKRPFSIHQGMRSVVEYSFKFQTLVADAGWNDKTLLGAFVNYFNEQLKDELGSCEKQTNFDSLVSFATRIDNRLRERHGERADRPPLPRSAPVPVRPKTLAPQLPLYLLLLPPRKKSPCS